MKQIDKQKFNQVMRVALPCIGEQVLVQFMSVLSSAIMGHVGKNELTAVAMVNTLVNWLQFLFVGLSTGTTVVIARMWGEEKKEDVKKGYIISLQLSLLIGVFLMAVLIIFSDSMLKFFFSSADAAVMSNLHVYFSYSMYGLPFMAVLTVSQAAVRGIGDNRTPFIFASALNIVYVGLSYIFVFGSDFLHIPPLGILGAGISMASARALTCLAQLVYVYAKKFPLISYNFFAPPSKLILSRIFSIGLPSCIEQVIFQGGFVILQSLLLAYGAAFQSGYQISGVINGIAWAPGTGIAVALTALVSQDLARRDYDGARETVRITKFITATAFVAISVVLFISSKYVSQLFTKDADVISVASEFVKIWAILLIPLVYSNMLAGILRGAGDAKYIAVTCTLGMWIGRIFVVWGLSALFHNGLLAVGCGVALDFITRSVMYHFRIRKGNWLYIKV